MIKKIFLFSFFVILIIVITYFIFYQNQRSELVKNENNLKFMTNSNNFEIKISTFKNNEFIPQRYTCDGEDINPLIEIKNPPANTKSFVLIMDDPDATGGVTWDHWILFNIDPKTQYITEGGLPLNSKLGKNSWGENMYGGPCPPKGSKPHRYFFKLYALDIVLDLEEGATKQEIEKAMEGHILAYSQVIGLYQRK